MKTAPRYRPAARDVAQRAAAPPQSAGGLIAQAPRRAEAEAEALQGDDAILTWATDANAEGGVAARSRRGIGAAPRRAMEDAGRLGPRRPVAPSTRGGRPTRRRRHSHNSRSASRRRRRFALALRPPIRRRGAWSTRARAAVASRAETNILRRHRSRRSRSK